MQQIDRVTIRKYGIPGIVLMESPFSAIITCLISNYTTVVINQIKSSFSE